MRLDGNILGSQNLTDSKRDQMFELMCDHYTHMGREAFDFDLPEKHWGILATDPASKRVRGFSTQTLLEASVGDELRCAAPLTRENFTAAAYRVIGAGLDVVGAK